jgi:hypothetical protein
MRKRLFVLVAVVFCMTLWFGADVYAQRGGACAEDISEEPLLPHGVLYRMRLNHQTESKAAISAITAAAAEKRAVISVSRVSKTRRLLSVS